MTDRVLGKWERLYRERMERDRREAPARGLRFDREAGDRVVRWVERYCHHFTGEWAGKRIVLEEWQREVTREVFGWMREDGLRRFRTAYIEIPRKNGKSTWSAPLGLYLMVGDGEPGAQVFASATKRDQAKIVWGSALQMVRRSPDLRAVITEYHSALVDEANAARFEPLGADSKTLDGLNPHGNIVDELHAHKDRGVWDVLDTAMGARRQPLTIAITTAGLFDPTSIGWEQHDYATKVLEGTFDDDAFFAYIAAADEGDDYFSEETQRKANPNYGVSVKPDYLAAQAAKAQRQPSFLNEYLRLHLNVWTAQASRWLSLEQWDRLATRVDLESLRGRVCFGGLDLSSKLDLTALVLAFPEDDGSVLLVPRFWLPEDRVKEELLKGHAHYQNWMQGDHLIATPGAVIDQEFIRSEVNKLSSMFDLRELAYDRWGATALATRLAEDDGRPLVEFGQGYRSMSEPAKDFEGRIISGRLRHDGNPVLRWCVSNVTVRSDPAGNIKPDKETSTGKIDGVVAAVMGLARANLAGSDSPLVSFV